jgi:hypothetical protein
VSWRLHLCFMRITGQINPTLAINVEIGCLLRYAAVLVYATTKFPLLRY